MNQSTVVNQSSSINQSLVKNNGQGTRRTPRALPPPPGIYHYGPKMYLRVSRTQSHLFPTQPFGMRWSYSPLRIGTPLCSASRWLSISFKSLMHYCFVIQWLKCSSKYACWFLPHHLEQTDTNFNYLLAPGEGLRADTVSWVSETWHNTIICSIFIIWRICVAYFGNVFFQITAKGISDLKLLD